MATHGIQVFEDIVKSEADDRSYRLVTLSNELDILLISDPTTDKASAALDVHVGHLVDPEEVAGLAHFCEHLLFMGTEKYLEENAYNSYLSDHGGNSNAFTAVEDTNYYFDVNANHLEGALDRFAQFFIAPLFLENTTDRELQAVDSEHKKNLQSDSWRLFQLEKDLSCPTHPYHKFGTGSMETLKDDLVANGRDIRKYLFDFHDSYYSANIMKLVILGKEPLDTLMEWAVSMFSAVKNKSIKVPSFPGHPLTSNELLKQILVKPVKDMKLLELTWPFPDTTQDYKIHPAEYISHLIGHEGEGSILAVIKQRGWALSLSGGVHSGGTNFDFFKINVELTDEGLGHWEEIVVICFQYITLIKKEVHEWIYTECQALARLAFRFKEKGNPSSYCTSLAGNLQHFEKADVLSGNYIFHEYRPDVIQRYFDYLRPDNFRIMVVSPSFDAAGWSKARYYGTEYTVTAFSDTLQQALKTSILSTDSELHLPEPNDFIPTNFDVKRIPKPETMQYPSIIRETPTIRLWHKKDDTFFVPKVYTTWLIKNPYAYASPRNTVLARLFTELMKDYLSEYSYYAEVAGLHYGLDIQTDGVLLTMDGYNDKLSILLSKVVDKIKHFHVDSKRYEVVKEQHERMYKNFSKEAPTAHAMYWSSYMLQEKMWSNAEKLDAIQYVKESQVSAFVEEFFSHFYIEAVIHGNEALKWADIFDEAFHELPLPLIQRREQLRSHVLHPTSHIIHARPLPNPANPNSSIEYMLQIGDPINDVLRSRTILFSQLIQEPCFDQLRTKEQLGYMVFSGLRKMNGNNFVRVIIQSEKDPAFLETRIEAFWVSMRATIETMSDDDFARQRQSLVSKLLEKSKKLVEEYQRLWVHIASGQYDFAAETRIAGLVSTIAKPDMIEFFDSYISRNGASRAKLSTHIQSASIVDVSPEGLELLGDESQMVVDGDDMEALIEMKSRWGLAASSFPCKSVEEFMDVKEKKEGVNGSV
ncbi:hypothetical protein SmJEL517_g05085 [Synchytrium microbalum]|uniref:Insulin-degrading enzyme n=1 Tax=Synchytrium microbalum TaxID=1806994 RepID=A0A507BNK7_9FUNG|nr:uncharacterized protein SmJEL517_g05085 [Synchytrium microbalum]TPX31670.1 hypothetical protein SmJEL517_g05085 [Synchytrium microbalum]